VGVNNAHRMKLRIGSTIRLARNGSAAMGAHLSVETYEVIDVRGGTPVVLIPLRGYGYPLLVKSWVQVS